MSGNNIWQTAIEISENRVAFLRLGPMKLWLARAEKEWGIAVEYGRQALPYQLNRVPYDVVPGALKWVRTAFAKAPPAVQLQPRLPDRPLVVRPAHTVVVPPRQEVVIYACFPVWTRVEAGDCQLALIASEELSDTWFGNYAEGLIGYSPTRWAESDREALNPEPHHIICPLHLINRSKDDLIYERMCLRTQHLNLYSSGSQLWTNVVDVEYLGKEKLTQIHYPDRIAGHVKDPQRLHSGTRCQDGALSRLTFGRSLNSDFVAMNK